MELVLPLPLPIALQVSGAIYSGSTGYQIGHRGNLGVDGDGVALLHVTRMGAQYILLPCANALCGFSVKALYERITGRDGHFKEDPYWENMLNRSAHRRLLHSSGAVRYLMNVPGKAGQDLLLVSSEACMLLDGQDLVPRWTFGATQVLRYVQLLLSLSRATPCSGPQPVLLAGRDDGQGAGSPVFSCLY